MYRIRGVIERRKEGYEGTPDDDGWEPVMPEEADRILDLFWDGLNAAGIVHAPDIAAVLAKAAYIVMFELPEEA